MEVSLAASQATTKCNKEFSCLNGNSDCLCWVKYTSGQRFVEIKPRSGNSCPYLFQYGNTTYCLCPTRNELYKRYRV